MRMRISRHMYKPTELLQNISSEMQMMMGMLIENITFVCQTILRIRIESHKRMKFVSLSVLCKLSVQITLTWKEALVK